MSKIKVKLDLQGINAVMKSPGVREALEEAAKAVGNASGIETEVKSATINFIAVATVETANAKAAKEHYKRNALLKGVSAVGLSLSK